VVKKKHIIHNNSSIFIKKKHIQKTHKMKKKIKYQTNISRDKRELRFFFLFHKRTYEK